MKQTKQNLLKWELTRERLRIEDRYPPPARRPERPIGDILAEILRANEPCAESIPKLLIDRWPMITGGQLATHVTPAYIQNDILYLYADHPGWLAESRRISKTQLLKKISSIPDVPDIKDIRFQLDPSIRTFQNKKAGC